MGKKITFVEALLTAVGLVIGSGIYFRADNILTSTQGNIAMATLGWIVLGICLIFAGIAFSVLANRTKGEGGMIAYIEETWGKTWGFIVGWFCTFVYVPTLTVVLAWVAAGYLADLFGWADGRLAVQQYVVTAVLIIIVSLWNYLSTKFAALFSSAATVIKLIPIVVIGLVGLFNFQSDAFNTFQAVGNTPAPSGWSLSLFTAPLLSMAFAFDGWMSVGTLSRDMENPQRDIGKVFAIMFVIITIAYALYFTGISMLGAKENIDIIAASDSHVGLIATKLFGSIGGKLILFCVVMSVMGTLNGNIMSIYRYPHALAENKDVPNYNFFRKESKYGTTFNAYLIGLIAIVLWFIMYFAQALSKQNAAVGLAEGVEPTKYFMAGIAFDDIPIVSMGLVVILSLIAVMKWGSKEGYGTLKTIIAPIIGIIGYLFIVVSFFQTNKLALPYLLVVAVICVIGLGIRSIAKSQVKQEK
ncbi:MAG: APC family permease [Bacilli bacterium]|jgi:APA family basic amino acid/polyamine antiporter|nr:APC family permease [Bacilli bacterium]